MDFFQQNVWMVRIPLSTAPPLVNDVEHTKLYAG